MSTVVAEVYPTAAILLADDLVRFDETLERVLQRQTNYLTDAERRLYRSGKRMRPLLLLLSARACVDSEIAELPDRIIRAAVSLEMLHVATLIHDDIIDAAAVRRGLPSIRAARGEHIALLMGDLQFVEAIRMFADTVRVSEDMGLVRLVLEVGSSICRGELDELMTKHESSIEVLRRRYLRTIDRKTASLFGMACVAGATLAGARTRVVDAFGQFGRRIGRVFQIMDDLQDFTQDETVSGKPCGADLLQRRYSLPIIYALSELPADHDVHRLFRGEALEPAQLRRVRRDLLASSALTRAYADARATALDAISFLELVPPGVHVDALRDLTFHIIDGPASPATEE